MSRFISNWIPWNHGPSRCRFGRIGGLSGLAFAVFATLLLLGETGFLPAESDAHVGLAVSATCNPPSSMPSALFIEQATPSHPVLQSGKVEVSYEFEAVNFTPAVNGTKVLVPNVLALFPLTSPSELSVNLPSVELHVAGAGWSNPTPTSNSSTAASNLSFSASNPPQLMTEGWLPNDPHADAVQADAVYGTITLAFRWSWAISEPNGTVYTSPWSTPSSSAAPPSLPSVFYPAELVVSQGETSPVTIGGNFTDLLAGHVAGHDFALAWTDSAGRQLAHGQLNVSSGATSASASLALTSPTHRLTPGTFVFRVKDACGALIQDNWRSASLATVASAHLGILPSACGKVILNGTVFADGDAPEERPSPSSYSLTSTGCPGFAFTGWSESGGVVPASAWARNTRLFVSWNGSVSAGWAPGYRVTFQEVGATKGQNWSVTIHGTTVQAVAPNPLSFLLANGSYAYYVGNATGYSSSGSPGTVLVKGGSVNLSVSLSPDIQHVVMIVMENSNLYPTLRYAPYMDYLWNTYAKATSFYGACHESKPEYMAMTSGRSYSCQSIPLVNVTHLGDLLEKRGLTWGSYLESMNTSCDNVSSHFYFAHHNPFLWYSDVRNNATRCNARDVNSRFFNQTLANGTLPTYSLYVPNNDDDCEWTVLPTCDTWLKSFLAPILNSTHSAVQNLVAHTAFVIAFDEAETNLGYSTGGIVNPWCRNTTGQNLSVCGGHIYLSVVSPFSQGLTYSHNATDYNLESTIEWLFGLGNDGGYDGTPNFPSMNGLFTFPQNGGY
ncbi:MAG TPA: alkaline phosphatase family protein [Thermoplasmata archaeon]|nr:alkaline phosphatase family protein [Thermoplasmata archaeon]